MYSLIVAQPDNATTATASETASDRTRTAPRRQRAVASRAGNGPSRRQGAAAPGHCFPAGAGCAAAGATAGAAVGGAGGSRRRAAQRFELHLHVVAVRRLGVEPRQRFLIRGACVGLATRRGERVAAQVGVEAGKRRAVLRVQHLQRLVVLLVVEHQLRQAIARDLLQFLFVGVVDDPLQLGARRGGVAGIELHLRDDECGARRITAAGKPVDELGARVLGLGDVVGARGLVTALNRTAASSAFFAAHQRHPWTPAAARQAMKSTVATVLPQRAHHAFSSSSWSCSSRS